MIIMTALAMIIVVMMMELVIPRTGDDGDSNGDGK